MNTHYLISLISFLRLVFCDTLGVTITDLNTKKDKCDLYNNCNINYGEVIRISFKWTIDDDQWNKPQVNIYDTTFIFSSQSKGGTMTYNVCPYKDGYQTSLIPCQLVLDLGTYNFGTTVTARQPKTNEKSATGKIQFSMNAGSPRSTDQPEFTINLSLPKK